MENEVDFEYTALEDFLAMRFNMLTLKGHKALTKLPEEIKATAFFSAKVGRAHILERLRAEVDAYTRGDVDLATARANLTDFLKRNGYIPGGIGDAPPGVDPSTWARRKSLRNLASTARLDLILNQNRAMAEAVGEYQRMYDPDVKEFFPCVIYHAVTDDRSRHKRFNDRIIDKDDPWLKTHFPPWEFNCRCWLEDCERPEDEKRIWKITPEEEKREKEEAKKASGYVFRPDLAFEANDLGQLSVKSRQRVVDEMTALVSDGTLRGCTFLAAPPQPGGAGTHPLPGMGDFQAAMKAMETDARAFVTKAGLDPDKMPDWNKQGKAFQAAGMNDHETMPKTIRAAFPEDGVELGSLGADRARALGLKQVPTVSLLRGTKEDVGIFHNWHHHKEMFVDIADSQKVLEETIGNPNARCVLSVTPTKRRIVIHNPDTGSYCVLGLSKDGASARIMSWHRALEKYGNNKWNKN